MNNHETDERIGRGEEAARADILTKRTRMRRHTTADLDASATLWADSEIVRHISGTPSTRSESWSRLLRYIGHWQALSFGYWVVEDLATGRFLGEVGLADHKRDMTPSLGPSPEIGWVMAAHAQGRGLATETVAAALGWSDRWLQAERTVCIIAPGHDASIRVAKRNGFVEGGYGRFSAEQTPVLIMERLKPNV
ncbi:MAG: GNAT family N-acetyltransferase [Hoeflea sp.]|uniref:GNAT family N-acetyltransferase n=1 Tax=Hoeflea sp. TaxID=1940281 RepID=UPI0032EFE464